MVRLAVVGPAALARLWGPSPAPCPLCPAVRSGGAEVGAGARPRPRPCQVAFGPTASCAGPAPGREDKSLPPGEGEEGAANSLGWAGSWLLHCAGSTAGSCQHRSPSRPRPSLWPAQTPHWAQRPQTWTGTPSAPTVLSLKSRAHNGSSSIHPSGLGWGCLWLPPGLPCPVGLDLTCSLQVAARPRPVLGAWWAAVGHGAGTGRGGRKGPSGLGVPSVRAGWAGLPGVPEPPSGPGPRLFAHVQRGGSRLALEEAQWTEPSGPRGPRERGL